MNSKPTPAWLFALPVVILLMVVMSLIFLGAGPPYQPPPSDDVCVEGGTGSKQDYVRTVIGVAKSLGINENGQTVAVLVMMAESNIQVYANDGEFTEDRDGSSEWGPEGRSYWLNRVKASEKVPHDAVGTDHDSVGLFQQRPSMRWADVGGFETTDDVDQAIVRLMHPAYSALSFFQGGGSNPGLLDQPGWENTDPAVLGAAIQRPADEAAYADTLRGYQDEATALVQQNQDAPKIDLDTGEPVGGGDSGGSSGGWHLPLEKGSFTYTSPYGDPRDDSDGMHQGTDFAAPAGTPIHAIADGKVTEAGPAGSTYGNWVIIDHTVDGKKYSSLYAHMPADSIKVSVGDQVSAGDHIADVGSVGNSTGDHLHLELWEGGYSSGHHIDPLPYVKGTAVGEGGGGNCGVSDEDRAKMIVRAQSWVDEDVKYCQGPDGQMHDLQYCIDHQPRYTNEFGSYRPDCSGYISMVWQLKDAGGNETSLTTATLPDVSHEIAPEDLQPGDILNGEEIGHVVMFHKWANEEKTQFWAYETRGGVGAMHSVLDLETYLNDGYLPRRYEKLG